MSDDNPILTVVIPTYDRNDLLEKCLLSLRAQTYSPFRTVVVEDGGPEDTEAHVRKWLPCATTIVLPANHGFAHAVNRGIAAANTPYVMLLNNDMVLEKDCLRTLMQHADDQHCIGPLVLDELGNHVYSAGDRIHTNGRPESIGFRRPLDSFAFDENPFGLTAGAAVYPGKIFETIGNFDEDFVAYFDDADFNARARLAGWSFKLIPEALAFHEGSASIEGRMWWRTRQCHRNHLLLLIKNFPFPVLLKHSAGIAAERFRGLGRVFSAVRADRGALKAVVELFRVYTESMFLVPRAFEKRRSIQRNRTISAAEFEALLHD